LIIYQQTKLLELIRIIEDIDAFSHQLTAKIQEKLTKIRHSRTKNVENRTRFSEKKTVIGKNV